MKLVTIAPKKMTKNILLLYVIPVSVIFFIYAMTSILFFDGIFSESTFWAWILASVNFVIALWSLTLAQKTEFTSSIMLVFLGGGIRMIIMLSSIIVVMLRKSEWMQPFCIVLIECFILYLIVEIAVIYRRGLLLQN